MNNNKEAYRRFCNGSKELPIFVQDWYLDALEPEFLWDAAVIEKGGHIAAVLPYVSFSKKTIQFISIPSLCKFSGPFIHPNFKAQSGKLIPALLEQIPRHHVFDINLFYSAEDWLPFHWKGYNQTTRYSYVIDLTDLDSVYAGISSDYRNNKIPKAAEVVSIKQDLDIDRFYEINELSFKRQGLSVPYSKAYFTRHAKAILAHNQGKFFYAQDDKGAIHSVLFLIWDQHAAYYHIAGDDPSLRQSGAAILLAWEAIKYTKEVLGLNRFDFEGSMIQSIQRVRKQFGAVQTPYHRVFKYNGLKGKLYATARMLLKG